MFSDSVQLTQGFSSAHQVCMRGWADRPRQCKHVWKVKKSTAIQTTVLPFHKYSRKALRITQWEQNPLPLLVSSIMQATSRILPINKRISPNIQQSVLRTTVIQLPLFGWATATYYFNGKINTDKFNTLKQIHCKMPFKDNLWYSHKTMIFALKYDREWLETTQFGASPLGLVKSNELSSLCCM